jgi:hypothetical protein
VIVFLLAASHDTKKLNGPRHLTNARIFLERLRLFSCTVSHFIIIPRPSIKWIKGLPLALGSSPGERPSAMDEVNAITQKYQPDYIENGLASLESLKAFAFFFYKDVSELYDILTRLKHADRNPSGFSIDDAPILGLLVRITKLLKEVVIY